MKAWVVWDCDDEDDSTFVLAETRAKAKYKGKLELFCGVEWTQLRTRREPGLDGIERPTDKDWHERTRRYAYQCSSYYCGLGGYLDTSDPDTQFVFDGLGNIYHAACLEEVSQEWEKTCDHFHEVMGRCEVDGLSLHAIREIMEDIEGV